MRVLAIAAILLVAWMGGASADPTVLRFTPLTQSGTAAFDEFYKPWADKVSSVAPDALKIDIREGTAIANIINVYDRVTSDVVQIGFTLFNYVAGKFPYAEVAALPNITKDAGIGSAALWRLYQTGALDPEFDQVKPLLLVALPQSLVHLNKQPKTMEDLSGIKLVAPTQMTALAAQFMGAQPITLSSPQAYEAIQRSTADGTILSWNVYFTFKIGEVTHYHIDTSMGTAAGMIFMSRKVYDGLSPAAKKAIDTYSGEAASRDWGKWWDKDNANGRASALDDPKQTVVTLDPATEAKWAKRLDGAIAEWSKTRPGVDKVLAQYKLNVVDIAAGK